jgi:hypothetical protein
LIVVMVSPLNPLVRSGIPSQPDVRPIIGKQAVDRGHERT